MKDPCCKDPSYKTYASARILLTKLTLLQRSFLRNLFCCEDPFYTKSLAARILFTVCFFSRFFHNKRKRRLEKYGTLWHHDAGIRARVVKVTMSGSKSTVSKGDSITKYGYTQYPHKKPSLILFTINHQDQEHPCLALTRTGHQHPSTASSPLLQGPQCHPWSCRLGQLAAGELRGTPEQ